MINKIVYILIISIIMNLGVSFSIAATDDYKLLEPLPCIAGTGNDANCVDKDGVKVIKEINIDTYIAYVFKFAIAIAALLAVVMIIWGGFQWMISESSIVKTDAKSTINNAVLGLVGVLASYLILQTIDPRLVNINTTIPKIAIRDDGSVNNFIERLTQDIQKLSAEQRDHVGALQGQIDSLNEKKEEINRKISNGEGNAEDLRLEQYQIDNQIKEIQIEQIKEAPLSLYRTYFKEAYQTMYRYTEPGNFLQKWFAPDTRDSDLSVFRNEIADISEKYSSKMEELGNYEEAKKITDLSNFYLDEINKEWYLRKLKPEGTPPNDNLTPILIRYSDPEDVARKAYLRLNNPYIIEEYDKIVEARKATLRDLIKKL